MSYLEKIFGRSAQTLVLENLINKKGEFTYLSGIARETGLSHSSVARVIEPLVESDLVIEKRMGKQIRTFTINEENPVAKLIIEFYNNLSALQDEK
ncbi:MAG: helix-turn-helix domain-containing protein [Candidatus Methanoperedens sp.]|nr:helix-turn-helix domain-containing protein [Candidatus Methanoperedens nitroreducens]MDJ1421900.1 helix-turn-helix domain-containing protein [Candidatus Methanoperedens sp.]